MRDAIYFLPLLTTVVISTISSVASTPTGFSIILLMSLTTLAWCAGKSLAAILMFNKHDKKIFIAKQLNLTLAVLVLPILFFFKIEILGIDLYLIQANSMQPTLKPFDVVVVNIDKEREYIRKDIVVFSEPSLPSVTYIKRAIGIPGDKLRISSAKYELINASTPYSEALTPNITVTDNHYYMLGDNMKQSRDSRHFGPVDHSNVKGKATFVWFNLAELKGGSLSRLYLAL